MLCSATGEVAFRIAERVDNGEVIGLEYDETMLRSALGAQAIRPGLSVRFSKALMDRIPFPDRCFDG